VEVIALSISLTASMRLDDARLLVDWALRMDDGCLARKGGEKFHFVCW